MQTKLTKIIQNKTKRIYSILIMLGCQLIQPMQICKENQTAISEMMEIYFQATDARLQIIEWLVATINPYYDQEPAYKNSYDNDPLIHNIKKISISLWQLGVMPFSKYTGHLQYDKYVQGLLGHENSVNLIYDLAILAECKYVGSSSKIDSSKASQLLAELIKNKSQLVNVQYDPYGVTFPAKILTCKDIDHEQKIINSHYHQILQDLKEIQVQSEIEEYEEADKQGWKEQSCDQQTALLQKIETYKQIFEHKYSKLIKKIKELDPKIKQLGLDEGYNKSEQTLHDKRMLNISKDFCGKYKQYRELTRSIKKQNYDESLDEVRNNILKQLSKINEIQQIFSK